MKDSFFNKCIQRTHRWSQQFLAIAALIATMLTGPLPVAALAGVADQSFTTEVESVPTRVNRVVDKIYAGFEEAAAQGIKNATRAFLEKIAYDAAVTLTSGCEFQGPCVNFKEFDVAVDQASDAAVGDFLNTVATQNGFVNLNLCDLPEHEKLELTLLLPQVTGLGDEGIYEPDCTFSEIRKELGDYSTDLQAITGQLIDDPTALTTFSISTMKGENALSSLLALIDEQTEAATAAERKEEIEQIQSGFKAIESPVSGYIKTPANVLEFQTEATYRQAVEAELTMTGHPFADALSIFTHTLAKRLLDQTATGLLSFYTEADINEVLSGESSGVNSSTSGGKEAARERFANLQTPSFTTGGELDVLNNFTNCPDTGVSSTNCVIGQDFRRAIEEKMTLGQATDAVNGPLISPDTAFVINSDGTPIEDYTSGINKRSIAILQSHGVIPATWMIAAEYNEKYDGTALTIGQLMDAFDDPTSPYFGLVDPDWVLKAPEVFCRVEGYSTILSFDEYMDTDGSDDTPDEHFVSRLSSCVDEQTCLSEDDNGNCEAYGYCTKYDDIYRFAGEECPAYYASCAYFENSDGKDFSVLTNTVNQADCSESTIGCGWRCGVYNEVDQAFQCATQESIYETCETAGGCSCITVSEETCTIEEGGFYCTTDSEEECTIGIVDEETAQVDAAITFDDDIATCSENDVGCSEFIPVKGGANLVFNYSFEAVNDREESTEEAPAVTANAVDSADEQPFDDTFGFYGAEGDGGDPSLAGEPCSEILDPQTCTGWEFGGGATARAVLDAIDGTYAMQLSEGAGFVQNRLDTGHALGGRTFTLNFSYMNPTSDSCTGQYWVAPDGARESYLTDIDFGTQSGAFDTEFADTITFPSDITETKLSVGFTQSAGCTVVLDAVTLVEDTASPGIQEYGNTDDLTYININDANECSPEEVGCTTYTPQTGESEFDINGQITNPLSDTCGNGEDYTDPSCSQCLEEFVGCDAYIEEQTPYDAPINDVEHFSSAPSEELQAAIAKRTGMYCDGTTTSCNSDADCESGVACLPSISIVPEKAEQCSAEAVGCEEYTNLDDIAAGGEGTEYYTFIQQCVKPTESQKAEGEIDFYYTFEGTESGYQLRSHYLKVSDDGSGAPCTNLDHYDYTGTAETSEADCVDSLLGAEECNPEEDVDCMEYYDSDANTYYRKSSEVIEVSESCISARNSLDNRVYSILPENSTECKASENLCREYKGSEGESAQTLIEQDFESEVWDGGASSAESLSVDTGLSMLVTSDSVASVDVSDSLQENQSYVIQFWAKGDGGTLQTYFTSNSTEVSFDEDGTTMGDEWKVYNLGPLVFENGLAGNETLTFEYDGAELYVDNVVLSESGSHYLIQDTLVTCNGYEGCEEYKDLDGTTQYLKSFTSLCEDDAVGCQALIDTHGDADNPFYTTHNDDNEYDEDDVPVGPHDVVTYTVTGDSLCEQEDAGCSLFGEPSLDAYETITGSADYIGTTAINDPDTYDTALCQEQQRWCDEWTEGDESVIYAKNFGERYCQYDGSTGAWVTSDGNPCPLQNENDSPSQPKGPICNGGARAGDLCNADSDCPGIDGENSTYRCVNYQDDDLGWTGLCSDNYAQCTLYLDPNGDTEVVNDSFEIDQLNNDDYSVAEADGIPDYWQKLNDGEVGSSSSSGAGLGLASTYTISDIISATPSRSPDSAISFWNVSDAPSYSSGGRSGNIELSGTYTDRDSGNPLIASGTLVGMRKIAWRGMSSTVDIKLETNNTTESTVLFTFPVLSRGALRDDYLLFHLAQNGNLYWADSGHDGVKSDGSDYLDPLEAMTATHLASKYSGGSAETVNGYYDALDLATEVSCSQFEKSADSFIGSSAFTLAAENDTCIAGTKSLIPVDTNSIYTLSAKVKASSNDATFALGLLYYDATGNEIASSILPQDYAFAAFEGTERDESESVQANTWVHYHGDIGPNLEIEFPEDTYYVRVFAESGSVEAVTFDDINFNENKEYTYIKDTVDTTSCNGIIDIANGCVPFRDTTNDSLTYVSAQPTLEEAAVTFTTQSCTFDSLEADLACRARAFSADANEVILVELDRECSEWLGCTDGEPIYSEDGELEKVVCYDVGLCTARNEETGACTAWAPNKDGSDLTEDDVVSTDLSTNNPLALNDIQKMSGHAQVGATWDNGECTRGVCTAGKIGESCLFDIECSSARTGYYPYNWMPYLGLGGSLTNDPVINNGDFEGVFCDGTETKEWDEYDASGVERTRDKSLTCTQDIHCRTLDTDSTLESYIAGTEDSDTSIDDITYEGGWCNNVDSNRWSGGDNNWSGVGANINIIDYDPGERERVFDTNFGVNYTPITNVPEVDSTGSSVAAGNLDLDNYMYVEPTAGSASYVKVELDPQDIIQGQEYTIQFNGGFTTTPQSGDTLDIFLRHGVAGTNYDYFVQSSEEQQLGEGIKQYTFGPVTVENKEDASENSYLYIGVGENNQGTAFVIDDVQIAANLAVNHEEHIGRECRAYPEDDSLECNYTDNENDTIHQGWQGFCTVRDPFDQTKCITWFPVDTIPGEPNFSSQDLLFWSGHFPVYYCLAAKGNEKLGTCTEGGDMCLTDADCSVGSCLGGEDGGTTEAEVGEDVTVASDNYRTTISIDSLRIDDESHVGEKGIESGETATFVRLDQNDLPILRNMHISEIDDISFDMGNPTFDEDADDPIPVEVWTLFDVKGVSLQDLEVEGTTDGSVEDYDMFQIGSAVDSDVEVTTSFEGLVYAYQRGVWCNKEKSDKQGLCQDERNVAADIDDMGLYFVKGITSDKDPAEIIKQSGGVLNGGEPYNPFAEGEPLAPESEIWEGGGFIEGRIGEGAPGDNNPEVNGEYSFDGDYFFSRWYDDRYSCMGTGSAACGANIMAMYVDVQDGYINAIYLVYWDGLHRVDTKTMEDITINIDLREVCLAATEVIDQDTNGTPWWQRAAGVGEYLMKDTEYAYGMEETPSLYGRMNDSNGIPNTSEEDGLSDDIDDTDGNYSNMTVVADNNLPYVYHNESFMMPMSCIGSCAALVCEDDRELEYSLDTADECPNDRWIGAGGVCSDDHTKVCDDGTDCDGTCILSLANGDGVGSGTSFDEYYDQLNAAVDAGWNRLRLVFADLSPDRKIWFAPLNDLSSSKGTYFGLLHEMADMGSYEDLGFDTTFGFDENITSFCAKGNCDAFETDGEFDFDAMDECSSDTRGEDEYCGIRPAVENIEINNQESGAIELSHGQAVTMEFSTNTDDEQLPVQTVMIDWESNPSGRFNDSSDVVPYSRETADGDMSYTHVYTCDPTQGDEPISGGEYGGVYCLYKARVHVIDNWDFCSGETDTTDVRGGDCVSYDQYAGDIIVRP